MGFATSLPPIRPSAPPDGRYKSYSQGGKLVSLSIHIKCKSCKKVNHDIFSHKTHFINVNTKKHESFWKSEFQCYSCEKDNCHTMDNRMFKLTYGEYI